MSNRTENKNVFFFVLRNPLKIQSLAGGSRIERNHSVGCYFFSAVSMQLIAFFRSFRLFWLNVQKAFNFEQFE